MRKLRDTKAVLALVMAAALLTGCGAKSSSQDAAPAEEPGAFMETMAMDEEAVEAEYGSDQGTGGVGVNTGEAVQSSERKLIRNIYMSVETLEFDSFMEELTNQVASLGGYIEQSSVSGSSYYYGTGRRYASLTARIPSGELDAFTAGVSEKSNVTNQEESQTDITLNYVDVESHKKALEIEHERLLSLLEKAETVEDIIAIETRLSEVRYELESYGSQLRTYDNQVNYSTVRMDIYEVERQTPAKETDVWDRIRTGVGESIYDIGRSIKNFCIGFVINLPYIVVWAVILFLLYILGKIIYHKILKKEKISFRHRKKQPEEEHKE